MVTVAQLVEPRTVTPAVAGSNPVSHPSLSSSKFLNFVVLGWRITLAILLDFRHKLLIW